MGEGWGKESAEANTFFRTGLKVEAVFCCDRNKQPLVSRPNGRGAHLQGAEILKSGVAEETTTSVSGLCH